MSNAREITNSMISVNEKLYISVDSIKVMAETLIQMYAEIPAKDDIHEEFILGTISGMEYFKDCIRRDADRFNIEMNLSDLGLSDNVKSYTYDVKKP